MKKTIITSNLSTEKIDLPSGRYMVSAEAESWSGVTLTPKAQLTTQVALKDVLGNTISFTANGYAIFEFSGVITFAGVVGADKAVVLRFYRL